MRVFVAGLHTCMHTHTHTHTRASLFSPLIKIKVKADELLASGDTAKAAIQYIVAKETNKGLELGLEYLKTEIAKGVYEYKQLKSLCEALECADLIHVKAEMRAAVLSYSLYFGLQEASWKGFTPPVIKWFANSLLKIVEGMF